MAGLGRGFVLTLPSIRESRDVRMIACAAPRAESRQAFKDEFGGRAYPTVEALCADPDVEAIYIATPHQMHREHAVIAAKAGKHILVEKPLAITMEDADAIFQAARDAGVHLITGPSHSFDQPVQKARDLIATGGLGQVRMIQAFNYTDFLYRPRRPEELDTSLGGGVVFSQAVHQIDVIRALMGSKAEKVFALTGKWDENRPTEGAYCAMIAFSGGQFASLTYSGYAHFDSDSMQGWIGELGHEKDPESYGKARQALAGLKKPEDEPALKSGRTYGAVEVPPPAAHPEHFGPVLVSCDRADLRLTPDGIEVWGDCERDFVKTPIDPTPRAPVLRALHNAIRGNTPPIQSGSWGRGSLEICHAILASARTGGVVELEKQ